MIRDLLKQADERALLAINHHGVPVVIGTLWAVVNLPSVPLFHPSTLSSHLFRNVRFKG